MAYNLTKQVQFSFPVALEKTKEALQEQGFGVISEIDLKAKFKEKLEVDFREYRILGACNPALAHRLLKKRKRLAS
jgi:uncharacterized protein (DUF302 family)